MPAVLAIARGSFRQSSAPAARGVDRSSRPCGWQGCRDGLRGPLTLESSSHHCRRQRPRGGMFCRPRGLFGPCGRSVCRRRSAPRLRGDCGRRLSRRAWRRSVGSQPGGWIYTGGLENYPALVDRWLASGRCGATPADVLRRVRQSASSSRRALRRRRLDRVRELTFDAAVAYRDGSWLSKIASLVRRRRRLASGTSRRRAPSPAGRAYYFQQFIEGTCLFGGLCGRRRQRRSCWESRAN